MHLVVLYTIGTYGNMQFTGMPHIRTVEPVRYRVQVKVGINPHQDALRRDALCLLFCDHAQKQCTRISANIPDTPQSGATAPAPGNGLLYWTRMKGLLRIIVYLLTLGVSHLLDNK